LTNLEIITQCREIRPNIKGKFQTTFGSSCNSFFRNRDCISLFDFRVIEPETFERHIFRCRPTAPASPECGIAVLLTSENIHSSLLTFDLCHKEKAENEMILPHYETGHPGPINLKHITKIIEITVIEDSNSELYT
jgi:hypothetical protein